MCDLMLRKAIGKLEVVVIAPRGAAERRHGSKTTASAAASRSTAFLNLLQPPPDGPTGMRYPLGTYIVHPVSSARRMNHERAFS